MRRRGRFRAHGSGASILSGGIRIGRLRQFRPLREGVGLRGRPRGLAIRQGHVLPPETRATSLARGTVQLWIRRPRMHSRLSSSIAGIESRRLPGAGKGDEELGVGADFLVPQSKMPTALLHLFAVCDQSCRTRVCEGAETLKSQTDGPKAAGVLAGVCRGSGRLGENTGQEIHQLPNVRPPAGRVRGRRPASRGRAPSSRKPRRTERRSGKRRPVFGAVVNRALQPGPFAVRAVRMTSREGQ